MPKVDKRAGFKQYPLRLPEDLFQEFREAAKAEKRSVNAQMEVLIRQWLAENSAAKPRRSSAPAP